MPISQRRRGFVVLAVIALVVAAAMSHYTVKPGDTLSKIANENGSTISELMASNDITNPDLIYVGQELDIHGGTANSSGSAPLQPTSITHIVAPGETLASIAGRYSTTSAALMALNGITNPNLIYVGTQLIIQGTIPASLPNVGSASSGTHTVQPGETVSEIAKQYGVSIADIIAANNLSNADFIRVGDKLSINGAGSGFVCPVPGGTFFNDYGFPRAGGRFHEGNDLFAPRGTAVVAPVSGFVHHLVGAVGGKQYRLEGNDGHRYIGTHMDSFGVDGQVQAGDVIGFVGDSGNAAGSNPHLHFEIHLNRVDVTNPYPMLAEVCR